MTPTHSEPAHAATPSWLTARPHPDLVMFGLSLTGLFLVGACLYFYHANGLVDPSGRHAVGRDFINLWTAGRLVLEGRAAAVFDVQRFHAVQEAFLGRDFPLHLWSYPPHFLFVVAPLGLLGYLGAFVLWSALTLVLYVWAAAGPKPGQMLVLAAAPATLVNLASGQTGALAAALFFGGLRLMPARPVLSGILFGLLTIKPQYGLLLPIVLLISRRWLVIAAAVATTGILIGLSAAVFGTEVWHTYLRENFVVTRSYLEAGTGPLTVMAPSAFMALRLYEADIGTAYTVQAVVALLAAVGVCYAWWSAAPLPTKVGVTGIASLLASPYAHNYDMTLLGLGLLVGYSSCRGPGRLATRIFLGFVWLLPIAIMPLHTVGLVVAPWALLAFYGWLLVHTDSRASNSPEHVY